MSIQTLMGSAAALALFMSAENLNAMKKATQHAVTEEKKEEVTTTPTKLEETKLENENPQTQPYTWGAYFTNTYFALTANPIYEKQKFPEITPSGILKYMDTTTTTDAAKKVFFKYTTGSSVSAPDYYSGTAFVDEIDYGSYNVQFLGADKGFSPHPAYISLASEILPYQFINDHFIKAKCDGLMCKGDLLKGNDTKTRLVYAFHNEKENKYIRVILRRAQ